MERTLDCFCKRIESFQSQRSEEAILDSYDKCVPRFTTRHGHGHERLLWLFETFCRS